MINEKSLENLKPVQPGEIRNPRGKAKGTKSIKTLLQKYLKVKIDITDPLDKTLKKVPISDAIAINHIAKAIQGDAKAREQLYDRLEGTAPRTIKQEIDLSGSINDRLAKTTPAERLRALRESLREGRSDGA